MNRKWDGDRKFRKGKTMNIDQLIYFLHVAETGSINAAAQKFYMTQQAISASIKKMEAELDTSLIHKTNRGVSLTPQGHIFVEHAQKIVNQYDIAIQDLQRFNAEEINLHGTISIFSASIFTNIFLPEVIREFTAIYHNTKIKIIEVNSKELLPYIFNSYGEIGLLSASQKYIEQELKKHNGQKVNFLPLMRDEIVLCIRPDHPLNRFKEINDEIQYQYAASQKGLFKYSVYQTLTEKIFLQNVYESSISNSGNAELHKKLIMEEIAVTYMPKLAYQYEFKNDGFASVRLCDSQVINHCLIYRDDYTMENHQLLQVFINFVQKKFQRKFGVYVAP